MHSDKKAGQRTPSPPPKRAPTSSHLQRTHAKAENGNRKPIANKLSANVSAGQTVPSSKKTHRPLMGSFINYTRRTRADQPLEKPTAPRSETKHRSRTNDRSHCVQPAHDLQSATSMFKRPVSTPIHFTLNVKNTSEKTPTHKQALFL